MTANHREYARYRDSSLLWPELIPAHWQVIRHQGLFRERSDKGHEDEDLLAVTIAQGVIPQAELQELTDRKINSSDDKSNYKLVLSGDLAYNKMRMWQGALGISRHRGIVSPAYVVLKPTARASPEFYAYLFRTPGFVAEADRLSYGLCDDMNSLRYKDFKRLYSVNPPLEEQHQIAAFLDYETTRIDRLIEKQQRLIELLQEKRQAVISHAVNPKYAGLSTKLGYYVDLLSGYAFPSSGFSYNPADVPLLRGVNVSPDALRWHDVVYWPANAAMRLSDYEVKEGDIVFGMDRPWIGGGTRVVEVKQHDLPALLLQRVARLRPRPDLNKEYLKLILKSREFREALETDLTGVSVPHISPEQILSYRIILPPKSEQREISDTAIAELATLEAANDKLRKFATLLREHRTALISAAVTGKIDVRDWQPPQSANETEERDDQLLKAAEERATYG